MSPLLFLPPTVEIPRTDRFQPSGLAAHHTRRAFQFPDLRSGNRLHTTLRLHRRRRPPHQSLGHRHRLPPVPSLSLPNTQSNHSRSPRKNHRSGDQRQQLRSDERQRRRLDLFLGHHTHHSRRTARVPAVQVCGLLLSPQGVCMPAEVRCRERFALFRRRRRTRLRVECGARRSDETPRTAESGRGGAACVCPATRRVVPVWREFRHFSRQLRAVLRPQSRRAFHRHRRERRNGADLAHSLHRAQRHASHPPCASSSPAITSS